MDGVVDTLRQTCLILIQVARIRKLFSIEQKRATRKSRSYCLAMAHHYRSYRRPVVKPFRIFNGQVNATVTHGRAKFVVPVCAVNCISFVEKDGPWHVWQIIVINAGRAAGHSHVGVFAINFVCAKHSGCARDAGRDDDGFERDCAFVGGDGLGGDVNVNPFAFRGRVHGRGRGDDVLCGGGAMG